MYHVDNFKLYLEICAKLKKLKSKKKIYLFGAPFHCNMGDQAQTVCIEEWLRANYPGYEIIVLETMIAGKWDYKIVKKIRKNIGKDDLIFLHSGYHTTDLYMLEENLQRKVIEMFPDYRIVAFPQTIYYKEQKEQKKASQIYNSHPNITILCRDSTSYETAKKIFANDKLYLFPDIVTTKIGNIKESDSRTGVLFCMRNDKEALYEKSEIAGLRKRIEKYEKTDITDTTIDISINEIRKNRKEILENIWKEYGRYKLVITDRYHGTIFSLIAGTPVIVLSSTDHKLKSGVEWFPPSFSQYIKYAETLDEAYNQAVEMLNIKHRSQIESYFKDNYYDKLKNILENN